MKKASRKEKIIVLVTVVVLFIAVINLCDLFTVESNFQLASSSDFPRWFVIKDYSRSELTMEMIYYTGDKVKIIVRGPAPEHKILIKKMGTFRWHPISEPKRNEITKYPNYGIITVDGVDEVFEQRGENNILYLSDDPKITSGYSK